MAQISKILERPPNGRATWLALGLLASVCTWFMQDAVAGLKKIEDKVSLHQAHISSLQSKITDRDARLDRIENKLDTLIQIIPRRRK